MPRRLSEFVLMSTVQSLAIRRTKVEFFSIPAPVRGLVFPATAGYNSLSPLPDPAKRACSIPQPSPIPSDTYAIHFPPRNNAGGIHATVCTGCGRFVAFSAQSQEADVEFPRTFARRNHESSSDVVLLRRVLGGSNPCLSAGASGVSGNVVFSPPSPELKNRLAYSPAGEHP